jgi:hypothetical protein
MKFVFYFAVSKTLDNLCTVLRITRSATACLPNSESIQNKTSRLQKYLQYSSIVA